MILPNSRFGTLLVIAQVLEHARALFRPGLSGLILTAIAHMRAHCHFEVAKNGRLKS
jgi:hypothetical protein